jgi:hypothetical protein
VLLFLIEAHKPATVRLALNGSATSVPRGWKRKKTPYLQTDGRSSRTLEHLFQNRHDRGTRLTRRSALSQTKQTMWQGFPAKFSSQIQESGSGKAGVKTGSGKQRANRAVRDMVANENDFQNSRSSEPPPYAFKMQNTRFP